MQNAQIKNDAPLQTTTSKKEAISGRTYDEKNLSFLPAETRSQPCLSFLYAISDANMPRNQKEKPAQKNTLPSHRMHEADRKFIDAGFSQARKICKDFLSFLIRYDSGITPDDAQILCAAVNAIERSSA